MTQPSGGQGVTAPPPPPHARAHEALELTMVLIVASALAASGFTQLANLNGGIRAWEAAGHAVTRD